MVSSCTKFVNYWRELLINDYGGSCRVCGHMDNLEFAHNQPTGLKGMSRGSYRRVLDILLNPCAYILLCHSCHKKFDDGRLILPIVPIARV